MRQAQERTLDTDSLPLDVTDDGFLSLMSDDGSTKDDVKLPDGEVGDKLDKLFTEEGKDVSKYNHVATVVNCPNTSADVIVLNSMGEQAAIEAKEAPKGNF